MLRRLAYLYLGLLLFGVMLASRLGLDPWDVFHEGLARWTGLRFGWVVVAVSALVLMLWIPLRQRPGIGTVSNVLVVGLVNGLATALYIGAGLGPGARDGLMTGLARRGHSIRVVRTAIEASVLAAGWLLGGTVGIGTVAYALSIGPLVHYLLPRVAATAARPANQMEKA